MALKRLNKKDYKNLKNGKSNINQNHLIFSFIDFNFDPDLITEKMKLKPLSIGRKGDIYFVGEQNTIIKEIDCNYWDYEWKINSNDFIGNFIDEFFKDVLIHKLKLIKEISSNCVTTRFTIVQYYYSGHNPGYSFEKEQIKILADINAEIDIDIYCLCED